MTLDRLAAFNPAVLIVALAAVGTGRAADPVPDARQQALFDKLGVTDAWKVTTGDPAVVVGVIDNGFDYFHPDLRGRVEPGYYYPGGYHPEEFTNTAHGTLVASLIVTRGTGKGTMAGLAPRCKLLTACQGTIEHRMLQLQKEFFAKKPKATMQEFFVTHSGALAPWAKDFANYQAGGAAEAIRYLTDRGVRVITSVGASGAAWFRTRTGGRSSKRRSPTRPRRTSSSLSARGTTLRERRTIRGTPGR